MSSGELICPSSTHRQWRVLCWCTASGTRAVLEHPAGAPPHRNSRSSSARGDFRGAPMQKIANEGPPMSLRSSPTFPKGAHLSAVPIVGFLLYASFFIYRTSFDVDGERYFSLFDDAMISMRYARNLAQGLGLVWNPGGGPGLRATRTPFGSSFMSFIHSFNDVADSKASLFVQVAAAAFLAANLFVVRKIALAVSDGSEAASLGAVLLTAFYLPINNWALQGMEVSVLVLIVSIALSQALVCIGYEDILHLPLFTARRRHVGAAGHDSAFRGPFAFSRSPIQPTGSATWSTAQ